MPVSSRAGVIAVVTSRLGVLVGRRSHGKPPWVFPGGKIERGESAQGAAVREVRRRLGCWYTPPGYSDSVTIRRPAGTSPTSRLSQSRAQTSPPAGN